MKKLCYILLITLLMISGCSNNKEEIEALKHTIEEKDITISDLKKELDDIKIIMNKLVSELSIYKYVSDEPLVDLIPLQGPYDNYEAILSEMGSKIQGKISNVCGNQGLTSITFDITSDNGAIYPAFLSFNDDFDDIECITIYINSELCYCWFSESLWPIGTGEWFLDRLSGE